MQTMSKHPTPQASSHAEGETPEPMSPPAGGSIALAAVGQAMTRMRLLIGRRFIGRMALKRMGTGLELSDIDAIGVIKRIGSQEEATVGLIAEQMRIDPSRGSRIVADLVRQGLLERAASQQDGRRSLLRVTAAGRDVVEQIEAIKRETITEATAGWSDEEIETFARLYMRFTEGLEAKFVRFEEDETR
ncbi:MarR family winged helix-turn-helix transcriptional regulator [Rhizobium sp. AAP43]|uniref:MarR family winged helix-turn-helix transcriptional regulator n=1 Tax=Rhizobium sp. AAP43 TaxID=1523420 RepID=UPI000A4F14D0|nr:MarR family winged helix-turn-helix transcriptional regulator [Rhizobium sp. AAP43]